MENFPDLSERVSIRAEITKALRGAIITGEMAPGRMYSAPALAEQFGVSATPVREAMVDLAREGLIDIVRNRGFRVSELLDEQLDDMAAVRMLLEVPTVRELAANYDESWRETFSELHRIAADIVRLAQTGDLVAYVETDRRFHLALLALAGNDELVAVVGDLRARTRLYGLGELQQSGTLTQSAAEHEEILNLITAGDADGAAALMRRHIQHVRGVWAGRPE